MRKIILLFAASVMTLTSCTENKQEVANTDDMMAEPHDDATRESSSIESILIRETEADSMIQRYHDKIKLGVDSTQRVSFRLDAKIIKDYLNNDSSIEYLDVYLATKPDGQMTLVYVGSTKTAEVPYVKDRENYVFDHAMPCPTCDRVSIHTPPAHASGGR